MLGNESGSRSIVPWRASRYRTASEKLMAKGTTAVKSALLCLACFSLASCASGRTAGERLADMPHWMGGLPADAPPRRGTPEYDEMMAKRAQVAARPKTEQAK